MLNHSWVSSFSPGFPWSLRSLGDFLHALPWSQIIHSLSSFRSSPLAILRAHSVRINLSFVLFTLDRPLILLDTTFWDELDVPGWVPESQRGYVDGKANNVPSLYSNSTVVAWNNSNAQYW